jgi:hypothetical protein
MTMTLPSIAAEIPNPVEFTGTSFAFCDQVPLLARSNTYAAPGNTSVSGVVPASVAVTTATLPSIALAAPK